MNNEVLNYTHPAVIRRFAKEFPDMADKSEVIFSDLMKFFWAGRRHEDLKKEGMAPELDFIYIMDEEMKPIDQMWHIFLLYTNDYMDFCHKYFGEYLHHLPDIVDRMEADGKNFDGNLEKFLSFSYDHLGEEVIRRWYSVHLEETA